jgi:phosphoribosylaminoimidazole (AIR) synthetase
MADIYRQEIVDPGDRASALGNKICVQSYGNCPAVSIIPSTAAGFRGPVNYLWKPPVLKAMFGQEFDGRTGQIKRWTMAGNAENDGAGGKPQFYSFIGTPTAMWGAGWEIIAMCADDQARNGILSCIMLNELQAKGVTEENFHLVEAAFEGYGNSLKKSRLVNITGEMAILKHSLTAFCDTKDASQLIFLWSGACLGLSHHELLITGKGVRPGMPIVGFWDPGYRCNGGTRLTYVTLGSWGPDIRDVLSNPEARKFVEKLTVPSQSYATTITRLIGWNPDGTIGSPLAKVHRIAHITGGGLWGKLGEALPEGIGAYLNHMPVPADCLLEAQELSLGLSPELRISDEAAYDIFHGGCAMHFIVEPGSEGKVVEEAEKDGILASIVGETIASPDREIRVVSRFLLKGGKEISPPK